MTYTIQYTKLVVSLVMVPRKKPIVFFEKPPLLSWLTPNPVESFLYQFQSSFSVTMFERDKSKYLQLDCDLICRCNAFTVQWIINLFKCKYPKTILLKKKKGKEHNGSWGNFPFCHTAAALKSIKDDFWPYWIKF